MVFASLSAIADMTYEAGMEGNPDPSKLSNAHQCFQELAEVGCGHPKYDIRHFKSCLNNSVDSLTDNCKTFAKKLYGKRS